MIGRGISSGAESVFVLEGHVRTRVGEGSYCWTNECSDKKEKVSGDCQWDKWGDSDLSLLPYGVEKEKLVTGSSLIP